MGDSSGVYTRTDGVRTGSTVCQQAKAASVNNTAALCDVREQDMATALNNRIFADGTNSPTANIPMASHKLTGLTAGTTAGDSVEYSQWNTTLKAPSGTTMAFFQAAAPTGWVQNASYNDAVLRVVSGTGGGVKTNGQTFSSAVPSGTNTGVAITQAQLPNYNLPVTDLGHVHQEGGGVGVAGGATFNCVSRAFTGQNTDSVTTGISVNSGGSGSTHTHTFTGSALGINYVDMILCTKT
jgi:hypothetical protein